MSELVHKVAKFGGTSMAQPNVVADIVGESQQDIIVVSAPGKAEGIDVKMTDQLIDMADYAVGTGKNSKSFEDLSNEIINRFEVLYAEIGVNKLTTLRDTATLQFQQISEVPNPTNYAMSLGEELSAQYFTELLNYRGIKAKYIDPEQWVSFSESGILKKGATAKKLSNIAQKVIKNGQKIVTPGFYGYDASGNRHLLGRGGSDRTGALAALALADIYGDENVVYENWTDQDGIKETDPRIVSHAKVIDELTYKEVREGANGGSGVLQGDTIRDLLGKNIKVVVRNTFNVGHTGTVILPERGVDPAKPVVAISGKKLIVVTIEDMGMADAVGYVEEVLALVNKAGLSFEHMPTSHDNLSITFDGDTSEQSINALVEDVKEYVFNKLCSKNANVNHFTNDVVYLVGEALRNSAYSTPVISSAIGLFEGEDYINLVQHPGAPCVAIFTEQGTAKKYIRKFHDKFINKKPEMCN